MDKRIMILSRALSFGGAERVATNLATYLSKYYDVILVIVDGSNNTYGTTVETIDLGLSVKNKGSRIVWYKELISKVNNIKKERKITHTISFLSEPDLANVVTGKNSRTTISVRNKQSALVKGKVKKLRDKTLFSKVNDIVALSQMFKQDLIKNYNVKEEKVKVIYNHCDKEAIEQRISEGNLTDIEKEIFDSSNKIVITAGRLSDQKGQWHLIRAFSNVVKKIPSSKLLILGEGDKKQYLTQLIRELGLENNVFLLGYKSNPYIYLEKADLFAFSSLFEGLGNILLEAMACKIPIISTDCDSGPRELLEPKSNIKDTGTAKEVIYGEYGVLTPVFDGIEYKSAYPLTKEEVMYSEAIIKLLSDKSLLLHYKKMSTQRGDDFSVDKIVQQWVDLIES